MTAAGAVSIAGGTLKIDAGAVVSNQGVFEVTAVTGSDFLSEGQLDNSGLVVVAGSAAITGEGEFLQTSGELEIKAGAQLRVADDALLEIDAGKLVLDAGANAQDASVGGSVEDSSTRTLALTGGTISGTGKLEADWIDLSGTLAPGTSSTTGTLEFDSGSGMTVAAGTDFIFKVAGAEDADLILFNNLNGVNELDLSSAHATVTLLNGYVPNAGETPDQFTVFEAMGFGTDGDPPPMFSMVDTVFGSAASAGLDFRTSESGGNASVTLVATIPDVNTTFTWTGGGGEADFWTNPANWDLDEVPTFGSNVVIPSLEQALGTQQPWTGGAGLHLFLNNLTIGESGELDVINGSLSIYGPASSIAGSATLKMYLDAEYLMEAAVYSAGLWVGSGGVLNDGGALAIKSGVDFGSVGTVNFVNGYLSGGGSQIGGMSCFNSSDSVNFGGTVTFQGQGHYLGESVVINGSLEAYQDPLQEGSPSSSAVEIGGDLVLGPDAVLGIGIYGTSDLDAVSVDGNLTITPGASLNIYEVNGSVPSFADSLGFLGWNGSKTGSFTLGRSAGYLVENSSGETGGWFGMKAYVFENASGGAWNDPANWRDGAVPGVGACVEIAGLNSGSTVIYSGSDLSIASLMIEPGNALEITGSLQITGRSEISGAGESGLGTLVIRDGTFEVGATAALSNGGEIDLTGSTALFLNEGNVFNTGSISATGGSLITNQGDFENQNSSSVFFGDCTVRNAGTFLAGGSTQIENRGDFVNLGGGALQVTDAAIFTQNGGILELAAASAVAFASGSSFVQNSGRLVLDPGTGGHQDSMSGASINIATGTLSIVGGFVSGTGTITAPAIDLGCTVSPGTSSSTGSLAFSSASGFTIESGTTFIFKVAGADDCDFLDLEYGEGASTIDLNGARVSVSLIGGYTPESIGELFEVFQANGIQSYGPSMFSAVDTVLGGTGSLGLDFQIGYGENGVFLDFVATQPDFGTTYTWVGGTGDWDEASNWVHGETLASGVPTFGSNVVLPDSSANVSMTGLHVFLNNLTVGDGGTLSVTGGSLSIYGTGSSLASNAHLNVDDAGMVLGSTGTLTSGGDLHLADGGVFVSLGGLTLANATISYDESSGTVIIGGSLTGSGVIDAPIVFGGTLVRSTTITLSDVDLVVGQFVVTGARVVLNSARARWRSTAIPQSRPVALAS